VVIISVVAEIMWMCLGLWILRYCSCCFFRRSITAISFGFLGVAAVGTSVYVLSVVGSHLTRRTCDGDKYEADCYRGLTKSIAAGCVRLLVS
jgi:hypothetical protein